MSTLTPGANTSVSAGVQTVTITYTPVIGNDHLTLVEIDAGADPNEAIVDGLTVAERIAYHRAYWGPGTRLDAEGYMVSEPANTIADDACVLG